MIKIELKIYNYYIMVKIMNEIIDNNKEIVNNIREIYILDKDKDNLESPTKLSNHIKNYFL